MMGGTVFKCVSWLSIRPVLRVKERGCQPLRTLDRQEMSYNSRVRNPIQDHYVDYELKSTRLIRVEKIYANRNGSASHNISIHTSILSAFQDPLYAFSCVEPALQNGVYWAKVVISK